MTDFILRVELLLKPESDCSSFSWQVQCRVKISKWTLTWRHYKHTTAGADCTHLYLHMCICVSFSGHVVTLHHLFLLIKLCSDLSRADQEELAMSSDENQPLEWELLLKASSPAVHSLFLAPRQISNVSPLESQPASHNTSPKSKSENKIPMRHILKESCGAPKSPYPETGHPTGECSLHNLPHPPGQAVLKPSSVTQALGFSYSQMKTWQ